MRRVKGLAAAAFAVVLTGCANATVCSLVGCKSEASLRVHDPSSLLYPLTVHACFDERCADLVIERQARATQEVKVLPCPGQGEHSCVDLRGAEGYVAIAFDDPAPGNQERTASAVVRDASGAVVRQSSQRLRLQKLAPNGERCGPVCWSGVANFG